MCGRIIQSGGALRYAIVDGMNVRDSRVHYYPLMHEIKHDNSPDAPLRPIPQPALRPRAGAEGSGVAQPVT
jgi:hypothetical protein